MIISASRRTDIPTYYSEWLYNRLREEYVLVRNPMNTHQIGRISLSPDMVDGLVLWTKNPIPMLGRLHELEKYNFYFQFTLNAYGKDVEPSIPSKNDTIIPAFIQLSKAVGRDRVIWRYDPILLNADYTMEYHCKYFKRLVAKLSEYTEKCTVSFLDFKSIQSVGMDDTFDVILAINNRKMNEAGFIEAVERERTEEIFFIDEDHVRFFDHDVFDFASIKTHDGGDFVSIGVAKHVFWGAAKNINKFSEAFRSKLRRSFLGTKAV